jgi:hypothetical protein
MNFMHLYFSQFAINMQHNQLDHLGTTTETLKNMLKAIFSP